jgi:ribonuclease HI
MISDNEFEVSIVQTQLNPTRGNTLDSNLDAKNIFVDGSGDGHICIIKEEDNEPIIERHPVKSNHESEWQALYSGLRHINSYDWYIILSDSGLIVRQFTGEFKTTKPRMRNWKQKCRRYINSLGLNVKVNWIPKHENPAARSLKKYLITNKRVNGSYQHW